MSDANDADDRDEAEAIRERKAEQLREQGGPGSGDYPAEPVHVESAEHFQELLAEYDTVLVDFYADWCGPCKMLAPTIEDLAGDVDAAVAKVDIDAHQGLAQQYQVTGVPTVYVFADGQPADRQSGVADESRLRAMVQQAG